MLVGIAPAALLAVPLQAPQRAGLSLAAWVLVTGALHLDGWADCCDAAFAPLRTPEQRRAILKDPHLGTFGVVGLFLLLALKATALAGALPVAAVLVAGCVGRWSMVAALHWLRPATQGGLAAAFGGRVPLAAASVTAALVLAVILALAAPDEQRLRLLLAAAAGCAAGVSIAAALARRFGGVSGDVCGAAGEAAELAVLWSALAWTGG